MPKQMWESLWLLCSTLHSYQRKAPGDKTSIDEVCPNHSESSCSKDSNSSKYGSKEIISHINKAIKNGNKRRIQIVLVGLKL